MTKDNVPGCARGPVNMTQNYFNCSDCEKDGEIERYINVQVRVSDHGGHGVLEGQCSWHIVILLISFSFYINSSNGVSTLCAVSGRTSEERQKSCKKHKT